MLQVFRKERILKLRSFTLVRLPFPSPSPLIPCVMGEAQEKALLEIRTPARAGVQARGLISNNAMSLSGLTARKKLVVLPRCFYTYWEIKNAV